jgi:hypothetical protein
MGGSFLQWGLCEFEYNGRVGFYLPPTTRDASSGQAQITQIERRGSRRQIVKSAESACILSAESAGNVFEYFIR